MDAVDRRIVNALQRGFPVEPRPFAASARMLGLDEEVLIERIGRLLDEGVLTRFGPLYNAERMGGALSLCAMRVPPERFEEVRERVDARVEVAHNYQRDHAFNMWFVLATVTVEALDDAIASIERETGLEVLNLPREREYFVGLHFEV